MPSKYKDTIMDSFLNCRCRVNATSSPICAASASTAPRPSFVFGSQWRHGLSHVFTNDRGGATDDLVVIKLTEHLARHLPRQR
jgi:hypothetical protein